MINDFINGYIDCNYFLYNHPTDANELHENIRSLWDLFVNRYDCYVSQKEGGNWIKMMAELTENDIRRHLRGEKTLGCYQIDPQTDTCKWACFDIDKHNETIVDDTEIQLEKICDILKEEKIPYVIERSGSLGSYHVWLFFIPTITRDIFNFMHKISKKALVDVEIFPKQKSLSLKSYGNQVKLPLGVNRRNGNKSSFFDDIIHVTKLISLKIIPDEIIIHNSHNKSNIYKGLLYCEKEILEEKIQLEGSEGHLLRVAIAANCCKAGWTTEDIVNLFSHLNDFNRIYTWQSVEYIRAKGYYCSCGWVKDKCWNLVKNRCIRCKEY